MNNDKNGWLDRNGRLWECAFNKHEDYACKLQKKFKLNNSIEWSGWIKVHCAGVWFFGADEYCGRQDVRPTKRQLKWLFKNDYKIK